MRLLLDTSVLVAAMVEAHPNHTAALPWLQRAKGPEDTVLVAAHTIAELYAVLTTLPIRPSISPTAARELISRNISGSVEVVSLAGEDYFKLIDELSGQGIVGGVTYDAVIMQSARKANADQVITLNATDFGRISPDWTARIVTPT